MTQNTKQDHFPPTRTDYIDRELGGGCQGRLNVNRHIMEAYAFPLTVYFRGTKDHWIGEPDEIVQGFFADRLARADFFDNWKSSGKRLRHWLINGFCFYLKERHRANRRDSKATGEMDDPVTESRIAEDMDRAWVMGLVRGALTEARALCDAQGLAEHWRIFEDHFYRGRSYERIEIESGIEPKRAAVMARTAARKFKQKLRELVRQDGVGEESIESEIRGLLEIAGVDDRRKLNEE